MITWNRIAKRTKTTAGFWPGQCNRPKVIPPSRSPFDRFPKASVGKLTGWPFDHQRATPRAETMTPSVAMKGGILV